MPRNAACFPRSRTPPGDNRHRLANRRTYRRWDAESGGPPALQPRIFNCSWYEASRVSISRESSKRASKRHPLIPQTRLAVREEPDHAHDASLCRPPGPGCCWSRGSARLEKVVRPRRQRSRPRRNGETAGPAGSIRRSRRAPAERTDRTWLLTTPARPTATPRPPGLLDDLVAGDPRLLGRAQDRRDADLAARRFDDLKRGVSEGSITAVLAHTKGDLHCVVADRQSRQPPTDNRRSSGPNPIAR
jgi:hypothetical protein